VTTKIPLAADLRCRLITGSPRQGNGTLLAAFIAVIADSSIIRGGWRHIADQAGPGAGGTPYSTRKVRDAVPCRGITATIPGAFEPDRRPGQPFRGRGRPALGKDLHDPQHRGAAIKPAPRMSGPRPQPRTTSGSWFLREPSDVASTGISLRTPADRGLRDSPLSCPARKSPVRAARAARRCGRLRHPGPTTSYTGCGVLTSGRTPLRRMITRPMTASRTAMYWADESRRAGESVAP